MARIPSTLKAIITILFCMPLCTAQAELVGEVDTAFRWLGKDDRVIIDDAEENLQSCGLMSIVAQPAGNGAGITGGARPVGDQLASGGLQLGARLFRCNARPGHGQLAARDISGWRCTRVDTPAQQRHQILEALDGSAEEFDALLATQNLDVIDLGLCNDLSHRHRDFGGSDFLFALRRRDPGASLVATLELLPDGDGDCGLVEIAIVATAEKILDFDGQFGVRSFRRLDHAPLRGLHFDLARDEPWIGGECSSQRLGEVERLARLGRCG